MLRTAIAALMLSTTLLTAASCSQASSAPLPPASPAATAQPAHGGQRRLVFFMNPNGRPCQVQDVILRGMGAGLESQAQVVRYKTTEPGDIARFEQYGIRSLPNLVLTDATGVELRRATPGIQSEEQIRALLAP